MCLYLLEMPTGVAAPVAPTAPGTESFSGALLGAYSQAEQ